MIRALLTAALLVNVTAPALAQDPRLVDRLYDPLRVVRIDGKVNVQAVIRFGEGETIENVAIGDSEKWQVTPNKRANLLFLKPLEERAATNMTVVTDRHTYLFDLVANPANRNPVYSLAFTYPKELEPVAEPETIIDGANALELNAANDPYAVLDPAQINFSWASKGDSKLLPERIYDDGWATFIAWPAGTPLPAILIKDFQGIEGPVNYAVRGDVIVVDGVPKEIVLRLGNDVLTLTNEGPARKQGARPPSALALSGPNMGPDPDSRARSGTEPSAPISIAPAAEANQ